VDFPNEFQPQTDPTNLRRLVRRVDDRWLYPVAVLFGLAAWQFIAGTFFDPIFFPTPLSVAVKGYALFSSGEILPHIEISLFRILTGFLIGSVLGAPLGLVMGVIPQFRKFCEPYVEFFRFIPAVAWLTPAVIWLGIGETSKVAIIVYTTIFIVLLNTVVGVGNVSRNKICAAQSLGANRLQTFLYAVIPATVPYVLTGMRLAMGNSFATVVSAEMIAANSGLGFLIWNSRIYLETQTIFVAIVTLGVLGFLSDRLLRVLIRRYAHQYGRVE
jgi:NitT/TauT family transport system permease protein